MRVPVMYPYRSSTYGWLLKEEDRMYGPQDQN